MIIKAKIIPRCFQPFNHATQLNSEPIIVCPVLKRVYVRPIFGALGQVLYHRHLHLSLSVDIFVLASGLRLTATCFALESSLSTAPYISAIYVRKES